MECQAETCTLGLDDDCVFISVSKAGPTRAFNVVDGMVRLGLRASAAGTGQAHDGCNTVIFVPFHSSPVEFYSAYSTSRIAVI